MDGAADMDLLPWNLSRGRVRTSDAGDRGWTATDGLSLCRPYGMCPSPGCRYRHLESFSSVHGNGAEGVVRSGCV